MSTETTLKVKVIPELRILDNGLKLAQSWVNNMSGSMEDEPPEQEFEARNPRLGLGAKASPNSNVGPSADPVERRLRGKLNAEKRRRAANDLEESQKEKNGKHVEDEDDSDDEPESRASAFTKKRMTLHNPSLQANKKPK